MDESFVSADLFRNLLSAPDTRAQTYDFLWKVALDTKALLSTTSIPSSSLASEHPLPDSVRDPLDEFVLNPSSANLNPAFGAAYLTKIFMNGASQALQLSPQCSPSAASAPLPPCPMEPPTPNLSQPQLSTASKFSSEQAYTLQPGQLLFTKEQEEMFGSKLAESV